MSTSEFNSKSVFTFSEIMTFLFALLGYCNAFVLNTKLEINFEISIDMSIKFVAASGVDNQSCDATCSASRAPSVWEPTSVG